MTRDNDDEREELKAAIVERMVRDGQVGSNVSQVDTLKGRIGRTDQQGLVEELIRELIRDPAAPVQGYGGGARDNVSLTSEQDAVKWLKDRDKDLWWV